MNDKIEKKWDGKERRVSGVPDRRGAVAPHVQEYPKMVDGVIYNTAADEKAAAKSAPKEKK